MHLLQTVNLYLFKWTRSQNSIMNKENGKCQKVNFFNLFNITNHYFVSYEYKRKSYVLHFYSKTN